MDRPLPRLQEAPPVRPAAGSRLDSWKEIARYLNRDVRTVQRWEETDGLPVYRHGQGQKKRSPVYAYPAEIDAWLRKNPPSPAEKEPEPGPATQAGWRTRRVLWTVVSLAILVAAGAVTWRVLYQQHSLPPLRVVPLTTYPGVEQFPAFSPDGKQVVFSWNGPKQDNFDLYIKFVDGGERLQLTTHPGMDIWPAWSPDGRQIAFVRYMAGSPTADLLTVPALTGAERKIREMAIPLQFAAAIWPGLCWTPDGKWIISGASALEWISVQTLESRRLVEPVTGSAGDCCPAISPDGRWLAFRRASSGRIWQIYILQLGPDYQPVGEPRQLTTVDLGARHPMWTADSREVLYITVREDVRTLWRVPYDGSRAASPIELGPIGIWWAISPRGDRLAYADNMLSPHIWRTDLSGEKEVSLAISSSKLDVNPQVSPDGKRIAYVSDREKGRRVWVSDLDGANPIDLAPIRVARPGPARWSPDGKQIAFECRYDDNDDVCTVPASGGAIQRLTQDPARDSLPSWSKDGKWIYFTSNRSGPFQIWKVPSNGNEAGAIPLTKGGGLAAVESMDGSNVYFVREQVSPTIWRVAAAGGDESQLGTFRVAGSYLNFSMGSEGIYYASSENPGRWFELWLYRFATGKPERIRRINKGISYGMSVSPDGRWLWFSGVDEGATDLYMVENFR